MKSLQIVNDVFENEFLHVSSCSVKKEPDAYTILFTLHKADKRQLNQLINKVEADPDVQEVLWEQSKFINCIKNNEPSRFCLRKDRLDAAPILSIILF